MEIQMRKTSRLHQSSRRGLSALALLLACGIKATFSMSNPNAVNVTSYQSAGVVGKIAHSFSDGLGKKLQSHEEYLTQDIVTGYIYDAYGRLVKTTKPFMTSTHAYYGGAGTAWIIAANAYYDGTTAAKPLASGKAYSEDVLSNDPLNRVKSHGEPGDAFSVAKHPVKYWYIGIGSMDFLPPPLTDASLDAKMASQDDGFIYHLKVTKDANGHYSQQISDIQGNVIETWADPSSAVGDEIISSVVYDNIGNPISSRPPGSGALPDLSRETQMSYLSTGEIASRTTPDQGNVQYIYNQLGQLRFYITERDRSELHGQHQFHYIKYDQLGREIERGVTTTSGENLFDPAFARDPNYPNTFDRSDCTIRNYDNANNISAEFGITDGIKATLHDLKGRLVALGTRYHISSFSTQNVVDLYSYDNEGRVSIDYKYIPQMPIQEIKYSYDLQGNVLTKILQTVDANGVAVGSASTWTYVYTNGRISKIQKDGKDFVQYTQFPTGELSGKFFLKAGVATGREAFARNIREWPTLIQGYNAAGTLLFEQDLNYDAGTTTAPQYNGNVVKSKYVYQSPATTQTIDYVYDQVDRLTFAGDGSTNYQEKFVYDPSGRITTKLEKSSQNFGPYQYADGTNQLQSIAGHPSKGDVNGNYVYDLDGNMVLDRSKKMTIKYDWNGLPTAFMFWDAFPEQPIAWQEVLNKTQGGNLLTEVDMTYDADGKRVLKKSSALSTAYVGDLAVFEWPSTGTGFKIDHQNITGPYGEEGRVLSDGVSAKYFFKDHLGSTRAVMNDAGALQEANEFYSYGNIKKLKVFSPATREKFTGKELDEDGAGAGVTGIQLSYFGARYYDAEIGMWISPDAKRQFASPYAYSQSPVNGVDLDGKFFISPQNAGRMALDIANDPRTMGEKAFDGTLALTGIILPIVDVPLSVALIPMAAGPVRSLYKMGADDGTAGQVATSTGKELLSFSLSLATESLKETPYAALKPIVDILGDKLLDLSSESIQAQMGNACDERTGESIRIKDE